MSKFDLNDEDSVDDSTLQVGDSGVSQQPVKLRNALVIEDDIADFKSIQRMLKSSENVVYHIEHVRRLSDGCDRLAQGGIHIVLLDLSLPDSTGLNTFEQVRSYTTKVPVIVLTGLNDQSFGIQATVAGAHDYLIKGEIDSKLLLRSIEHARSRHRIQRKLTSTLESLRDSEEQFRSVAQCANDAIVLADESSTITAWNPAAAKMFGYPEDAILGKPLTTLMPASFRDFHARGFERYKSTGEASVIGKTVELKGLRRDGSEFPVELSLSTWNRLGQKFFCGVLRDITQRKQAEAELVRHAAAEQEIQIAREVQKSLFPARSPSLPGFDIAGAVFPATQASGDYFDFLPLKDGTLGLVIADVSGHGLGSAPVMAQVQAFLWTLARLDDDLDSILEHTNGLLAEHETSRFITLFMGRLDAHNHTLVYTSAGHPGFLINVDGEASKLETTAPPLGVLRHQKFPCAAEIILQAGDVVLLPTDGIYEARSLDGELFGVERMCDVVAACQDQPAADIVRAIYHAARSFSAGRLQDDDIAAVVVKIQ